MRLATHARPRKRRFVDRSPRSQPYDALHRVADAAYPAIRRLFVDAWEAVRAALPWQAVGDALQRGDLPAILVLVEQAWMETTDRMLRDPLRTRMQQIVGQSARASEPALVRLLGPRVAMTFDATSPHVLAYVREHSGQLIRDVGTETRQAIRALLVQNMQAGKGWQSLVGDIREIVGVTVRQADALVALRTRLLASGMNDARVGQLVAQKTRAYIRLRARTVARHESLLASNAGAHLLHQQLVADGVMDPALYRRFLVITPDERLCKSNICRDTRTMNTEGVGVLEPFQTPTGPQMYPPLHVLCRCTTATRAVRSQ